jgi:D-alanine-D-alanine ligase
MDASGTIHMLEINPNCGIFYPPHEPGSADFSLLNDPTNHEKFMKLIIRNAHNRRDRIAAERVVKRQPRKRPIEMEQMAYS